MTDEPYLNRPEVSKLEQLIEEAMRSTREGVGRFIEPTSGTLARAISRQHHLVFGRRGSGKSSLLRKAAADLTVDRRPIAFVDLEVFKGHAYPDVLLSVLIETFSRFADWLETAAIAPANKVSFWIKQFFAAPTRPAFNKAEAKRLSIDLRNAMADLRDLLYSEDNIEIEASATRKEAVKSEQSDKLSAKLHGVGVSLEDTNSANSEATRARSEKFKRSKLDYLHRHILDYQKLFQRMATLSGGDAYLFLDDLYHIRRSDQAQVVDYFHRIAKSNNLWLKIGTIRHRTTWYKHGDPPIGTKIGDDIDQIELDQTLERYNATREFLEKILGSFLVESGVDKDELLVRDTTDRMVLASGGVARDFLGILRKSILIARERGDTARGQKVGVEDVNGAAGEYDASKREELSRDTLDDRHELETEFTRIGNFTRDYAKANVFLVDNELPEKELEGIEELVDLRLVHRVKSRVSIPDRKGKTFEAFMLDVSQYTASRKKQNFALIPFWRADAPDVIRRAGLIYKELGEDGKVSCVVAE